VLQLQGWSFRRVSGWDFAGHLYSASASSQPKLSLPACGGIFGSHSVCGMWKSSWMRQEVTPGAALISSALANDQSDVIVLWNSLVFCFLLIRKLRGAFPNFGLSFTT
jgi:hypothetical protein